MIRKKIVIAIRDDDVNAVLRDCNSLLDKGDLHKHSLGLVFLIKSVLIDALNDSFRVKAPELLRSSFIYYRQDRPTIIMKATQCYCNSLFVERQRVINHRLGNVELNELGLRPIIKNEICETGDCEPEESEDEMQLKEIEIKLQEQEKQRVALLEKISGKTPKPVKSGMGFNETFKALQETTNHKTKPLDIEPAQVTKEPSIAELLAIISTVKNQVSQLAAKVNNSKPIEPAEIKHETLSGESAEKKQRVINGTPKKRMGGPTNEDGSRKGKKIDMAEKPAETVYRLLKDNDCISAKDLAKARGSRKPGPMTITLRSMTKKGLLKVVPGDWDETFYTLPDRELN